MSVRIVIGDAREKLAELPDESVHCVVTSPPYYGLRDYGVAGQIGLEPTPAEFVAVMVDVFREVRRVLRKDGTLWLNLGDSYASSPAGNWGKDMPRPGGGGAYRQNKPKLDYAAMGIKAKDLLGIPWRVAFALQADGWYLRQDVIWAKPNPMPESVTDRCTKAHEYLFLLSKSARYHYDAEAIKEAAIQEGRVVKATGEEAKNGQKGGFGRTASGFTDHDTLVTDRNRRSVWTVAAQPFKGAHFAPFPPDLIEPCIKAGCPKDCCAKCGAPVVRQVERIGAEVKSPASDYGNGAGRNDGGRSQLIGASTIILGWSPSCSCFGHWEERDGPEDWISAETGKRKKIRVYVPDNDPPPTVPGTVLDPFGGAGTTGLVADRLQRDAILIELNPEYIALAGERITDDAPLFAEVGI